MTRVFFSYHYAKDICRVRQVRTTWLAKRDESGRWFEDGSLWEKAATRDDSALRKMIDHALDHTSVTVVLIGAETAYRKYVTYEIQQSLMRGNGLLGVYIHQLPDGSGMTAKKGPNPLDKLTIPGTDQVLSTLFETFDWVDDNGAENLGGWVKAAASRRLAICGTSAG